MSIRPLEGIRVFEHGVAAAGPICGRYLAHFGAEVIKIESLAAPDMPRSTGPGWLPRDQYGSRVWMDMSVAANEFNAGTLSLCLDLKSVEGLAVARRLMSHCDVFLTNYSARAVASLDLDYNSVRAAKPDIVYLSMAAFGTTTESPYYPYLAYGPTLHSLSGLDSLTVSPDGRTCGIVAAAYTDFANGLLGAAAILGALEHRERTGQGQCIDLAQFDAAVSLLGPALLDIELTGQTNEPIGNRVRFAAPQGIYRCRGADSWVAVSVLTEDHWLSFCTVAGHPEWKDDQRFRMMADRLANHDELDALIGEWTLHRTPFEVAEWLQRAGVPACPVMDNALLAIDQQLVARDYWQLPDHPRWGKDLVSGIPIRLCETPGEVKTGLPSVGQHTEYVLGRVCGYSDADIEKLIANGTVSPMDQTRPKVQRRYLPWIRHFMPQLPWPEPGHNEAQAGDHGATTDRAATSSPPSAHRDSRPVDLGLSRRRKATGALSRYRILDLSEEPGGFGTKLLAEMGADVIMIEPPEGSRTRQLPPLVPTEAGEASTYFAFANTNKRSVTLALGSPGGRDLFRRLVAESDAVVETFAPGYLASLDIGYEQLRQVNPNLVWVSVTSFGLTGPRRDWKGSDLVAWAASGLPFKNGFPDDAPLAPAPSQLLAYKLNGLNAAIGCLLALRARDTIGCGQLVDISTQEAALGITSESGVAGFLDDLLPRVREGHRRSRAVPWGIYPCRDGYVQIVAFQQEHWLQLAAWISEKTGNEEVTDPVFHDRHMRIQCVELIESWVESLTTLYGKQEFFEEGQRRDIPAAPVNTIAGLSKDPHLDVKRFWTVVDDPMLGKVRLAGPSCRMSETPFQTGRAPIVGEHNEQIYGEELGLALEHLESLRRCRVI